LNLSYNKRLDTEKEIIRIGSATKSYYYALLESWL